jgi:ABC-type multidrug transport system fused ATPase/permease subunit
MHLLLPGLNKLRKISTFVGPAVVQQFWASAFLGFFIFVIEGSFIFVLQGFLNSIGVLKLENSGWIQWYPKTVVANILILISFGVMRLVVYVYNEYIRGMIIQNFNSLQRERILEGGLKYPQKTSIDHNISLFSDVTLRAGYAIVAYQGILISGILVFFYFISGLCFAWKEMLIGTILLGLFSFPLKRLNHYIDGCSENLYAEWKNVNRSLINGMRHFFFLSILNRTDWEFKKGVNSVQTYLSNYKIYQYVVSIKQNLPHFLGIIVITILSYLGLKYLNTPNEIMISFFYMFIRLAQTLGQAVSMLVNIRLQGGTLVILYDHWNTLEECKNETKILKEKLTSETTNRHFKNVNQSLPQQGITVEVKNLSFQYGPNLPLVLNNLSIGLKPGNILVITGPSGAGKSTLLHLILGLYPPTTGDVLINNCPAMTVKEWMAPMVGYSSSDPFWFQGSLREILLYGHASPEKIQDSEIMAAISIAEAQDFVCSLPQGLDSVIYEHAQLSTGQKQRLSLARMALRNPKLIILDEFTSNLDSQTETNILKNLKPYFAKATTIIVTHRPSLLQYATQTVELDS